MSPTSCHAAPPRVCHKRGEYNGFVTYNASVFCNWHEYVRKNALAELSFLAEPLVLYRTYAKLPWLCCPCRARLRWHAQTVSQARSMLLETPAQLSLPYWRAGTAMSRKRHSEGAPYDLLRCAVSLARRYAGRTVLVGTPCQDNFA